MIHQGYMTLKGQIQGAISKGCSSAESIGVLHQPGHEDEITLLAVEHDMNDLAPEILKPIIFTKHIDLSSPLLNNALKMEEKINCTIDLYDACPQGNKRKFYSIIIKDAEIAELKSDLLSGSYPQEPVTLHYQHLCWLDYTTNNAGSRPWHGGPWDL